jgi:nitroreductase
MNLQEAIDKRHSIREFESKSISKKILKELIQNATKAPSSKNEQNYIFYVASSKFKRNKIIKLLQKLVQDLKPQFDKLETSYKKIAIDFYSNLGGAPIIIFAYRKIRNNSPKYQFPNDLFGIACAFQNISLSAIPKGLGTCWIGTFSDPKIQKDLGKILKTKKDEELVSSLLVGYPKKNYKPLIRKNKKLNEILKFI